MRHNYSASPPDAETRIASRPQTGRYQENLQRMYEPKRVFTYFVEGTSEGLEKVGLNLSS